MEKDTVASLTTVGEEKENEITKVSAASKVKDGGEFTASPDLEQIRQATRKFCNDRGWAKFHTPRNLLLALVGEVGELSEIFQWRGEVEPGCPGWKDEDKVHLGEEMSDVLIYLIRMADVCGVDLPSAVARKMKLNDAKYPVDKVYGSSDKYTQYLESAANNNNKSSE